MMIAPTITNGKTLKTFNKFMSVYDQNAFHERVTHATRCIRSGNMDGRAFDTCFEMFDGDVVATALTRKAERDPEFKERITQLWGGTFPSSWTNSAAQYTDTPDRNLPALSRRLITERSEASATRQRNANSN
jgi:hypothetical protein